MKKILLSLFLFLTVSAMAQWDTSRIQSIEPSATTNGFQNASVIAGINIRFHPMQTNFCSIAIVYMVK